MKESRTALGVAWMRAAHQILDPAPRLLEDAPILDLLGRSVVEAAILASDRFETPGARSLRSHVALRSRFTEDRLEASRERGLVQFVILGAGYDTFFARQPRWAHGLRLTEIDQPATQADKRARIAAAQMAVPANVTFGSVNFEVESLAEGLARHGVDSGLPTFFSWLGVTMYLTEPAIDSTLAIVRAFPPGSEIVLTFASRPAADDGAAPPVSRLARGSAGVGEPWLSYFEPEEMERKLLQAGFAEVSFLTPAMAVERYFGKEIVLPPPTRSSIVSAIV
jgi:methyltransferase (TIGR00027 family)